MIEIQAADTYVYEALSGDSVLVGLLNAGVDSIVNQNPVNSLEPAYVVFDNKPSNDTLTNGDVRVMATFNLIVQAFIDESVGQSKALADEIDGLFETDLRTGGIAQNGYWIVCYRTRPWNRAVQIENRPFRMVGANFLLKLRPLISG